MIMFHAILKIYTNSNTNENEDDQVFLNCWYFRQNNTLVVFLNEDVQNMQPVSNFCSKSSILLSLKQNHLK